MQQGQINICIIISLMEYFSTVLTLYIGYPITTGVRVQHTQEFYSDER